MKSFKILSNSSVFISKQKPKNNFNNSCDLVIGQYNTDEFRGLLNFSLNPKIFNLKIYKVDLIIYLDKTNIDSNIEAFMLNIGRNFNDFNPDTVTFETAPKFFQEAHFSKIEAKYSKNCVIINVSKILEYWLKNKIPNLGMTLLGLTQNSLIYISNSSTKKPYLEIYLDEENNTPCNLNSNLDDHKDISEDYQKNNSKKYINCNKIDKKTSSINSNLVCGNFICSHGILLNKNSNSYIKFDTENNTIRSNLTLHKDGIYILCKGLYKVDFFLNCRSEDFSTVELELNNCSLPMTQVQISSNSPTYSSTIINVPSDNMILKLKISTINAILLTSGNCASLNLIKIN